jgi:ABC-2 type transport system ATP-binding protein
MDEPVANLDPKARIEFFELLMKLRQKGKSIFISSHVLAELDRYSDSLTVLDGGKIVYTGSKQTLLNRLNNNRYICICDDNAVVIKYLKKESIQYKFDRSENKITILFSHPSDITKFQKHITNLNVRFITFDKIKPTLDEIYEHLVIKGSVDTMKE